MRFASALSAGIYVLFAVACFRLVWVDKGWGLALGEGLFTLLGASGLAWAAFAHRHRSVVAIAATMPPGRLVPRDAAQLRPPVSRGVTACSYGGRCRLAPHASWVSSREAGPNQPARFVVRIPPRLGFVTPWSC